MRNLWAEFKSFAFKGNMLDLAVAVVIGTAFTAVVNSLVKHVLMPLVSYVLPQQAGYQTWQLGRVQVGLFIGEIINFALIALAVFLIVVKIMGTVMKKFAPPPAPAEPVSKECPFCCSTIPLRASKCGHCTADLPALAKPA